jgi:hypothetical protein
VITINPQQVEITDFEFIGQRVPNQKAYILPYTKLAKEIGQSRVSLRSNVDAPDWKITCSS